MKFIAHRGNVNGINPSRENTVSYIEEAINMGFDVEIDLWRVGIRYFLGHDAPHHEVDIMFLREHSQRLWCHAKDIPTLYDLTLYQVFNCFLHDVDDCALTSHGYLWTYFNKPTTEKSIILAFDKSPDVGREDIAGICSDYISHHKLIYDAADFSRY